MQVLGNHQTAGSGSEASAYPHNRIGPLPAFRRLRSLSAHSLIIALLSPFLALTHASVQKILLAVVIFDIPLQFGTHLFYDERVEEFGAMGGLSISAATIALAGLYVSWFVRSLTKGNSEERRPFHISRPLLLYLAFIVTSVFVAQDTSLAVFETCLFIESLLLYVYVANCVRTRQDVMFAVSVLLAGGLVEALVIMTLSFTGMPSAIWGLPTHIHVESFERGGFMRIGGTVGSANTAAAYFSFLLSAAVSLLFTNLGRSHKLLAGAVLGFGGIALILTFSRGGWIALVVSTILFGLFLGRQRGLSVRAPIAVIVILALLYLPFHSLISARLLGDDKGSAESRIPLMNLAFRIFEDNPILGVGANNFSVVMGRYLTPEFRHGFLYAVHDKYLLVLTETGIGGLLTFLAFLFAALRRAWQCWNVHDSFLSPLALGFMVGIVGHMVHMNVDIFRGRPIQQLLWLIAALLVAMHRMRTEPSVSAGPSRVA
jgi:putative inorganic carbon (HCO3(-)) transporter